MTTVISPRKLLVLGASGRTGRLLVAQALEAGHQVRAFVRRPEAFGITHPALEVFRGDVLDAAALARAAVGCDAVLSALGRDGKDVRPMLEGTTHLIAAMKSAGIRRVVCLSSMGAGSTTPLAGAGLNLMIRLMGLRGSFDAKAEQERALLTSGLEATVLFAGSLTDGPITRRPRVSSVEDAPRSAWRAPRAVSRADVAFSMLEELAAGRWIGRPACVVGA